MKKILDSIRAPRQILWLAIVWTVAIPNLSHGTHCEKPLGAVPFQALESDPLGIIFKNGPLRHPKHDVRVSWIQIPPDRLYRWSSLKAHEHLQKFLAGPRNGEFHSPHGIGLARQFPQLKRSNGLHAWSHPVSGIKGGGFENYGDRLMILSIRPGAKAIRIEKRVQDDLKEVLISDDIDLSGVDLVLLERRGIREWIILNPRVIESIDFSEDTIKPFAKEWLTKIRNAKFRIENREIHYSHAFNYATRSPEDTKILADSEFKRAPYYWSTDGGRGPRLADIWIEAALFRGYALSMLRSYAPTLRDTHQWREFDRNVFFEIQERLKELRTRFENGSYDGEDLSLEILLRTRVDWEFPYSEFVLDREPDPHLNAPRWDWMSSSEAKKYRALLAKPVPVPQVLRAIMKSTPERWQNSWSAFREKILSDHELKTWFESR
ncbi:MAG: hypothetical protein AB7F86_18725 [Bdellovibrionales bacterium]